MKREITESNDQQTILTELESEKLWNKYRLSLNSPDVLLTPVEKANIPAMLEQRSERRKLENEVITKIQLHELLKANNVGSIGDHTNTCLKPSNPLEQMLIDEMTSLHSAGMGMLSQLTLQEGLSIDECNRIINASTKLLKCFQTGMITLHQYRNGGNQMITVKHQNVQINGGQAVISDVLQPTVQEEGGCNGN